MRLLPGDFVNISAVVGEWQAAGRPWHIVFRADKTIGMRLADLPGSADVQSGAFRLEPERNVSIKLKDGRSFMAEFRELTPDQFDLVDSLTLWIRIQERWVFARAR